MSEPPTPSPPTKQPQGEDPATLRSARLRLLIGVGLLSSAMLGLEMLAIRWISILFFPVAAYLVIALALLGLGVSGGILTLRRSLRQLTAHQASVSAVGFAAATLIALALAWTAPASGGLALALIVGLSLPFFFAGLALSILFGLKSARVSQVYFADLLGAGMGAIATMLTLGRIDGVRLGLLIAAAGFAAAVFLSQTWALRATSIAGAGALVLVAFVMPLPFGITPVAPKELARALRLEAPTRWEWSEWNPLARIDVVSFGTDLLEPTIPLEYKLVTQDGSAPSLLIHPEQGEGAARLGEQSVFGIPFWIRPQARALIIGLGGGPDLLTALEYDPQSVDVVEVNPAMINLVQGRYGDFVGNPLADRRVHLTEGDGRFFVARSQEKYDVIQLTGVDTGVASAAGSPNLAENYLYTLEAFRLYVSHLAPDGLLAVSFPNVDGLGLRLVNLATLTLAEMGVDRPEDHLVISEVTGYVHVLMKRSPFTEEELEILQRGFQRRISSVYFPLYHRLFGDPPRSFVERSAIVASPDLPWPGEYGAYLTAWKEGAQDEFLRSRPQRVDAPLDDRPFVFVLDKWGHRAPNYYALTVSFAALAATSSLLLIVPPAILQRRGVSFRARVPLGLYFLAIGLGYILLEVTIIQKLALFLGHPSYALTTTIGSLLVASALGSLASGMWKGRPQALVSIATVVIAVFAVAMIPMLRLLTDRFLGQPLVLRVLASFILLAVLGFFMGIPFPTGLGYIKSYRPTFVPWAWGLNATASVSATLFGLLVALHWGLNVVFVTSAALYCFAALAFTFATARTRAANGQAAAIQE